MLTEQHSIHRIYNLHKSIGTLYTSTCKHTHTHAALPLSRGFSAPVAVTMETSTVRRWPACPSSTFFQAPSLLPPPHLRPQSCTVGHPSSGSREVFGCQLLRQPSDGPMFTVFAHRNYRRSVFPPHSTWPRTRPPQVTSKYSPPIDRSMGAAPRPCLVPSQS